MDSMENWLGFSLSHQEIPSHQDHHTQNSINPSGHEGQEDCFLPSLNLPPPFGILEAFNTSNHSQDWNVNDNYKSNSGMSVQMGSNSYNNPDLQHHQAKLENFLSGVGGGGGGGGNSFTTNQQYSDVQCYNNINGYNGGGGGGVDGVIDNNNNNNTTIGLSMIKNWLRSNDNKNNININDHSDHVNVNVVNNVVSNANNGQSLSLSMSTGGGGSHQSTATALPLMTASSDGGGGGGGDGGESSTTESKQSNGGGGNGMGMSLDSQSGAIEAVPRKSIETFGQRTSIYRGVTRHRWTGRYEAHLWDNSCRREGQTRKGRQVYLGGYDKEEKAARSYDCAALKYWGTTTTTNFPFSDYEKELEVMKNMTRQEYVASLRRKSSGFSRGASIYRGVTRHHQHGRWQARIGRVAGNKDLYLGTFGTQEEAAEAYDIAAIKFRGLNAVTNFEINRYDVKSILESSTLPIGGAAKRLKDAADNLALQATKANDDQIHSILTTQQGLNTRGGAVVPSHVVWPSSIAFQQAQPLSMYPYNNQQQRLWCKQEYDHQPEIHHQDHSFHNYGNTHNFFQQPHVLHNLMSLDSSSLEHSSDSNSIIYNQGVGYGSSNNMNHGYVLPPMGTANEGGIQNNQVTVFGENESSYENMLGLYNYHSQQHSANGMVTKSGLFDQGSSCDNWAVPTTAVQALAAARSNNMGDCTLWNDA